MNFPYKHGILAELDKEGVSIDDLNTDEAHDAPKLKNKPKLDEVYLTYSKRDMNSKRRLPPPSSTPVHQISNNDNQQAPSSRCDMPNEKKKHDNEYKSNSSNNNQYEQFDDQQEENERDQQQQHKKTNHEDDEGDEEHNNDQHQQQYYQHQQRQQQQQVNIIYNQHSGNIILNNITNISQTILSDINASSNNHNTQDQIIISPPIQIMNFGNRNSRTNNTNNNNAIRNNPYLNTRVTPNLNTASGQTSSLNSYPSPTRNPNQPIITPTITAASPGANTRNNDRNNGNNPENNDGLTSDSHMDLSSMESNAENNIRELIYSILKSHTIAFFFFIFILLYIKFQVSFYYSLVFLWLVDIYGIVTSMNMITENQEPDNNSTHIVDMIEHLSIMTYKILLVISIESKGFYMMFCMLPFCIIFITKIGLFIKKQKFEGSFLILLFFTIQMLNISLKYDRLIAWNWREVFWIYWVMFSLMIGITFALLLLLISKCTTYLLANTRKYEIRGVFWLFFMFSGITILSCAFVTAFINYLDARSIAVNNNLANVMYGIIIYCLVSTIITLSYLRDIEKFLHVLTPSRYSHGEINKKQPKKEEKIHIPKFLLKISSTYFGRATETDLKQLDQKPEENKAKKRLPKMKHLKTNSFDYSKLSKATDNTLESHRENPPTNLMTIISARSKEDLESGRQKQQFDSKLPKAALELLELKGITQTSSVGHLCLNPIADSQIDNLNNYNGQSQIESKLMNDTSSQSHQILGHSASELPLQDTTHNVINKEIQQPQEEQQGTGSSHRRFKSAMNPLRPKDFSILEESHEETNRSKVENMSSAVSPANLHTQSDRSVLSCLICFDKPPDAVFMECGHGGICYECSLEVWKATNECYLCRKPITQVLQLDLKKSGKSKVIKVISSTQMVNYEEEDEKSDNNIDSSSYNEY